MGPYKGVSKAQVSQKSVPNNQGLPTQYILTQPHLNSPAPNLLKECKYMYLNSLFSPLSDIGREEVMVADIAMSSIIGSLVINVGDNCFD